MLISVHLPKTAGSSFAALLEHHFGAQLARDYADKPLHQPGAARKVRAVMGARAPRPDLSHAACVHGHFLPLKYRDQLAEGARFVTWLREPLDRLQSHYLFWRGEYDSATAGELHRQMLEQDWTFERFALGTELRNLYSLFLWRFPLTQFAFIGLFEDLEADSARFGDQFLWTDATLPMLNQGAPTRLDISDDLRERIYRWHADDVALYAQARQLRDAQHRDWQSGRA